MIQINTKSYVSPATKPQATHLLDDNTSLATYYWHYTCSNIHDSAQRHMYEYSCRKSFCTDSLSQSFHVGAVSISIAFAAWVLVAPALCIDPSQWGELNWRVESGALIALGSVSHLTDHGVLMATLAALKVADPDPHLLADGNSRVPLLAGSTLWRRTIVGHSYVPALDVVVVLCWITVWAFKLPPMPRHTCC